MKAYRFVLEKADVEFDVRVFLPSLSHFFVSAFDGSISPHHQTRARAAWRVPSSFVLANQQAAADRNESDDGINGKREISRTTQTLQSAAEWTASKVTPGGFLPPVVDVPLLQVAAQLPLRRRLLFPPALCPLFPSLSP
eukprot:SAG31_NODE_4459_length_3214_cov_7.582986_1_plen_138_part_10